MNRSTIIASLALVVAVSGGSYAVADTLVTSASIKNGTILKADLAPATLKALKGDRGPRGFAGAPGEDGVGTPGPAGTPGAAGVPGAPGVAGGFNPAKIIYVTGPTYTINPGTAYNALIATCPAGSKVLSGGWFSNIGDDFSSHASIDGQSYTVLVQTFDWSITGTGNAYAVCAAA